MRKTAVLLVLGLAALALCEDEKMLFEGDSLYHHIIVSETSEIRILRFHKGRAQDALGSDFAQSIVSLADPYSLHMNYARYAIAAAALVEKPARALFVGLGAGSLPKYYARAFPDCKVDVAELDPVVVDVARKYFFLPQLPNLNIVVADGRQFIRKTQAKYDFVLLDAYRDEMIPFHLMTKDFLEELKTKLSENAVVVSNIAITKDVQLYPWVRRTYQGSFSTLLEAGIPGTINSVLVARAAGLRISSGELAAAARKWQSRTVLGFDLVECASAFTDASAGQPSKNVLTDDYAPVNLMRLRKADEKDWEY